MAIVATAAAGVNAAADQSVDVVLARAAEYVAAYERDLGSVIAEERYRQDVSFPAAADPIRGGRRLLGSPIRLRTLRSEFLLLRAPDPHDLWLGFRDILYVDDRPTPDRARLQERLVRNPDVSDEEFQRLVNESARYNIGGVTRNVNVPTFALLIVQAAVQPRFSFEKREERRLAGTQTWALAFKEQARPTIIRGSKAADLAASGTIWVDPASGRVIQTELIADEPLEDLRTQITVKYGPNGKLGIWVPIEMTERYHVGHPNSFSEQNIHCVAMYSNFRRFEVDVKIRVPNGLD